ncbi:hypothetical protein [Flavobacterium sp. ACN6]|uniref:hypothetical protein n=1 Tax=Flavobacterium sp. ACN6 TaxID=1920426 RepID=UPI000BB3BB9B|nr:hypothetical protein [Flavobacterium sp. ACN6]PBJ08085.1 hypothetical protein BSF42_38020 [Flavobacterium sp. ACN6]
MKTVIVTLTFLSTLFLNSLQAQEIIKDSLFFKYDPKYILNFKEAPEVYYLQDSHDGSTGTFFFKEVKRISSVKKKNIKCLKKFIRSSEFYSRESHLDDREAAVFFNNFIVFLMKKEDKKTTYIQVQGSFEIE